MHLGRHGKRNLEKDDALTQHKELNEHDGKPSNARSWKPITLRTPFLVSILLISAALIAVLQWLLYRSRTEGGVLFAPNVNELPLSKTFAYLYAPTIIAAIYSILWNWIDLDIKRLEPFFQLHGCRGVLAEDSLLLQYPFDFIALVPLEAVRRRHWSVFSGGLAVVLVFWTLTPLQSGIFATEDRVVSSAIPFVSSTSYLPTTRQHQLSALYAQHAYNIAWLNESLPPYMTRDVMLSPFRPRASLAVEGDEVWNSTTSLYSVDVACEAPVLYNESYGLIYNSSNGCSYPAPDLRPIQNNDTSKFIEAMYVGYQDDNGMADYYLSSACPSTAFHTFLIRMAMLSDEAIANATFANTVTASLPTNSTALYCQPRYYVQAVNASVFAANGSVISVNATGEKKDLPADLFNMTTFEWVMSSAQDENYNARGDFATIAWPDQKSHFVSTPLDMAYLPKMAPFAFAAYQMPSLESYMDVEILRKSYQAAYRLLFVRQMADILQSEFAISATQYDGQRTYQTQAIILVPGFTYAVEALLGVVMILASSVLYFACTRRSALLSNPSTMASMMSIVADDADLLTLFSKFDKHSVNDISQALRGSRFSISSKGGVELISVPPEKHSKLEHMQKPESFKGVLPPELQWYSGLIFLSIQVICIILLGYLYQWARTNDGIPLPSKNRFVRQLVENYVPTAVATLFEPFWTLLNRLLCVLQPFEELRKGRAHSPKSIALDYNSLPPQLVLFKALRAGHVMLATICMMSLLANFLSVAFSGLFFENLVSREVETQLRPSLSLPFRALNGTAAPFNSNISENWQGGTTKDEFYIAMSNILASTELPPWTDPDRFYLPVDLPQSTNVTTNYTVTTTTFGANLHCEELVGYNLTHSNQDGYLNVSVALEDGSRANCRGKLTQDSVWSMSGPSALELSVVPDSSRFCRQYVVAGWWRGYTLKGNIHTGNGTTMLCRPHLLTGTAEVTVDHTGHVLRSNISQLSNGSLPEYFMTEPEDLIAQAHQFIIDTGAKWHSDNYSSDFDNYLIAKSYVNNRFLNPDLPAPRFAEVVPYYVAIYNRLFAILLGHNKDLLFTQTEAAAQTVTGKQIQPETRIFLSFPAFIIAEVILCLYVFTTTLLYTCRPWRILPRLPTTVASTIAFFAASYAVKDFENTACMNLAKRNKWLQDLDYRWGFGTFMGTDRCIHVGVEREPFVNIPREENVPRIKRAKMSNGENMDTVDF